MTDFPGRGLALFGREFFFLRAGQFSQTSLLPCLLPAVEKRLSGTRNSGVTINLASEGRSGIDGSAS